MQQSPKPRQELERARNAIDRMKAATNHAEFEDAWKEYLSRLERAWNKAQAHFMKSPKWHSWAGKYITQRRADPLLKYLTNARGAEEHSVGEITERVSGNMTIGARGGAMHVYGFGMSSRGLFVDAAPATPDAELVIGFKPERTKLLPVVNRGVQYDVPTAHLGDAIDPNDVLNISECGVKYYSELLNLAEAYFIR